MTAILIMARAPRAGKVKTRLEPLLGPEGCARLQAELIRHTGRWTARSTQEAWLAFTPADADGELAGLVSPTIRRFAQKGGDLGERLRHATEFVFRHQRDPLTVIGIDAPELGPVHLRFAEQALANGHDACLIPALDGGYALIALARPTIAAFDLPPEAWGGPDVLELTLIALGRAGCSSALLEPVRDLDTPSDAGHVAADPRCPEAIRHALEDVTVR
jgi:rSAM/selenodomain-associated transferase 1